MNVSDTNSNAPTFDIASLPSVHEHDWRDSSFLDENKTAAAFTLDADGGTVEDPYSERYRARESEGRNVEKQQQQQHQREESQHSQPYPPSVQPTSRTMINQHQQRVTFEEANSATEQEVVHINAMFQPPSTNNTGNSAQGPSGPSNYYGEQAYHSNNHQQFQIPQGYVPNKYSAHYDPNMPDWEGVTITERTMADISTVTPPPDDYYNPYAPPPVAMVAAATPGTPWEELEETDAERADWKNPKFSSDEKGEPSVFSAEQSALGAQDRRLLKGLVCLVCLLLVVVVAVAVPISLQYAKNSANPSQSNEASNANGNGNVVTSPSLSPSIWSETVSTRPAETCENPPCDKPPVQPTTAVPDTDDNIGLDPTTAVPVTDDSTDSDGLAEPLTTEPATTEPVSNGRTKEPTLTPVTSAPTGTFETPQPNPSPSGAVPESTPEPTPEPTKEPTPEPTKEPTPEPSTQQPTESLVTDAPTPPPVDSVPLWMQNLDSRAIEWIEAHNSRRQFYHEQNGKTFVPLVWSSSLAEEAETWLDESKSSTSCTVETQDRDDIGQTTESYWSTSNATLANPEEYLVDWVDEEADLEWNENKKFTQAIWRASKYVGCADSVFKYTEQSLGRSAYCHLTLCNYIRKGNCNMWNYDDWSIPMLMDDTGCGDECPSEGCYWKAWATKRMLTCRNWTLLDW